MSCRKERWKEINELENGKHSTCHSEWHDTTGKVVHVHCTKVVLLTKAITLDIVTGCLCNKEWANCCISIGMSDCKDTVYPLYSIILLKRKWWVNQSSDFEKLICNPRQTSIEHKKVYVLLPAWLSQSRPGYHPNNKITLKSLWQQRNSMDSACEVKTQGSVPNQNAKPSIDNIWVSKQIINK